MRGLNHDRQGRAGFTLVELLVVMVIIVILATLAVALVPRVNEQQKATNAAGQVSGWMLIAKQRAKRDRHPVGVRLQVPLVATSATQVAQPGPATISYVPVDPGQKLPSGTLWSIAAGSYLLVADNDQGWNPEVVGVQGVGPNSFTAVFSKTHPPQFRIRHLGYVQTLQYVEQPEDFMVTVAPNNGSFATTGGPLVRRISLSVPQPNPNNILQASLEPYPSPPGPPPPPTIPPDFTGGLGWQQSGVPDPSTVAQWPVQPGDYLELLGGSYVHQILSVEATPPANPPPSAGPYGMTLYLYKDPLFTPPTLPGTNTVVNATDQYRIIRGPRPLRGEADLQLPPTVVIDLGTNWMFSAANNGYTAPLDLTTGSIDVLFSPSGAVIGRGTQGNGQILLWVRDTNQDTLGNVSGNIVLNEPALVSVYPRTGFIATHPVDMANVATNPYTFTQDGRSSGM